MRAVLNFFKKEAVLCISGILAVISCFIVPPSSAYAEYIDFRVLILLFCLMLVVAGIRQTGAFTVICDALLKKLHSIKTVGLVLVLLSFFMSMLLTNDVSLVTIVPFTLLLFENLQGEKKGRALIILLVLETVSANLGSMLTPMGNPQNLYLYSKFNLSFGEFFKIVFPYSALSLVILIASVFLLLPKMNTKKPDGGAKIDSKFRLIMYIILFAVNMLTILRILNDKILLAIVVVAVLLLDRRLFGQADYSLLLTFVFFFIFVGNMGSIPALSEGLGSVLRGREVWISAALSQVISNVPASILLSRLSDNAPALIVGINLGGLGTLIASMASLITYKFYARAPESSPKKYILTFTIYSVCCFAVLAGLYLLIS